MFLLGGGDATVGNVDPLARRWRCNGGSGGLGLVGGDAAREGFDVVEPGSAGGADGLDFLLGVPSSETICTDPELLAGDFRFDPDHFFLGLW